MAAFVAWGRLVFIGSSGAPLASWRLEGARDPDLDAVDALARALLAARRAGGVLRLVDATDRLVELLDLAGLRGQMLGEAEGGEEAGVEEGVEPGDLSV
jgi:hypothetical protein